MTALLLALLAAPPISSELQGAPFTPRPSLQTPPPARGRLPVDWAEPRGWLDSANEAAALFAQPGAGEPAGLACRVELPETFPLSNVRARTPGFRPEVISGSEFVYLPTVPTGPVRLGVYRDEIQGRSMVGEVILGVMSAGLSLLRLNPTHVASFNLPARGGTGKQGRMRAECRLVARAAVEAARGARLREPCASLDCLRADASLLGPQDAAVLASAQAVADNDAALAQDWRGRATWRLSSLTIEEVRSCGQDCRHVTLSNQTPFPVPLPSVDEVRDADGRQVNWSWHLETGESIGPHGRGVARVLVSLRETAGHQPGFPLVVRLREDRWYEAAPGSFARDGSLYTFGPSRCGPSPGVLLPVSQHRFAAGAAGPDGVTFASGHTSHISFPFSFRRAGLEPVHGEATVYPRHGCEAVVAVSGPSRDPVYFTLP